MKLRVPNFFAFHNKKLFAFSQSKKADFYQILNISRNSTKLDVKKAFHKMGIL